MDAIFAILYWVQVALLAVAAVFSVWLAVRGSGRRAVAPWRAVVQGVLAAAVFAVVFVLADAGSSIVWTIVLLLIGGVLGYLLGRGEKTGAGSGRPGMRRSGVAPWVWALSVILVALTMLFGSTFLFGLAVLVMAFALGLVLGQIIAEVAGAGRVRQEAGTTPRIA